MATYDESEDISLEPSPIDRAAATADLLEQMRLEEEALTEALRNQSAEADRILLATRTPESRGRPIKGFEGQYGTIMPTSKGFMYVGNPVGEAPEQAGTVASRVAAATLPPYGSPSVTSINPESAQFAARMAVNQLVERGTPVAEAMQRFPDFFPLPKQGSAMTAPVVPVQVPGSPEGTIAPYVYNPKTGAVHFQPANKSDVVAQRLRYKYETELQKAKTELAGQMAREEGLRNKRVVADAQARIAQYTQELAKLDRKPMPVSVAPPTSTATNAPATQWRTSSSGRRYRIIPK